MDKATRFMVTDEAVFGITTTLRLQHLLIEQLVKLQKLATNVKQKLEIKLTSLKVNQLLETTLINTGFNFCGILSLYLSVLIETWTLLHQLATCTPQYLVRFQDKKALALILH